MKSIDELIDDLLTLAFAEDVGDGDIEIQFRPTQKGASASS